ncbi:MAG TPA: VWA domain-containing protein [Thermoanaerobaculia bacterium]|nr:VWA domain-containing protein [Thermoanaerobaculia bacterium]
MRKKFLLGWLGAAGLALAAPIAPATAQTFSGSTEVVEVEVPVQVVRDGQPVRGLTAADFELYEGRKKLAVTGFHAVDLAAPAARGGVPPAGRRQLLLLFDLAFSNPKAVVAAREAARSLVLKGVRPGDLVGVATYSAAHGPQILLGFTSDRRQVDAALDVLGAVRDERSGDPLRLVMKRGAGDRAQLAGPSVEADTARSNELIDAQGGQLANLGKESTRANEKAAATALTRAYVQLAQMLRGLPGRKQVVYFSEGFNSALLTGGGGAARQPGSLGVGDDAAAQNQDALQQDRANQDFYLTDSEQSFGSSQAVNALERMLEEFRRSDCVIQAVDIGGLRAGGEQAPGARGGGQDTLLAMARGTGGELVQNSNDLSGAIGGILDRTSVTYVLSFQPDKGKPGDYHKLRVELKNAPRGTRVSYRPGYFSPKPYGQLNPLEKLFEASSRLMGGEEAGTVPGAVLAAPFRGAADKAYVPVLIEADGPALLAGAPPPALPVEVYVYALDAAGAIQDFLYQQLGLDLAKAGAGLRQGGLKFVGHLDLPPGEYSLRTLVRNGASGAFSLRVLPLTVPAFGKGPALLPPLFPDTAASRWVLVREAPRGGPPVDYPFMARQQPYVPASRPVLASGAEVPLALVGYDLGPGDLKVAARLLAADGREAATGGVRLLQREATAAGGPDRLLAAFRPPALPPGEYTLSVTLTGAAGAASATSAPFVVRAAH